MSDAIYSQDDKTDEFLEHFGVKGMRWGKRGSSAPKPTAKDIKAARDRVGEKEEKIESRYNKSVSQIKATAKKGKQAAAEIADREFDTLYNSSDAKFANRMTRGEKAAAVTGLATYAVVIGALAASSYALKKG